MLFAGSEADGFNECRVTVYIYTPFPLYPDALLMQPPSLHRTSSHLIPPHPSHPPVPSSHPPRHSKHTSSPLSPSTSHPLPPFNNKERLRKCLEEAAAKNDMPLKSLTSTSTSNSAPAQEVDLATVPQLAVFVRDEKGDLAMSGLRGDMAMAKSPSCSSSAIPLVVDLAPFSNMFADDDGGGGGVCCCSCCCCRGWAWLGLGTPVGSGLDFVVVEG